MTAVTIADVGLVPREVVDAIRGAKNVLTICHENPEADALGSALGVALAVEYLGGRATPVCVDPVPDMYHFLSQIERFRSDPDPGEQYDLVVVTDCGEIERIGDLHARYAELLARVPVVNIDHHKSNDGFGTVSWVDPTAAAACEMVTLLLGALDVPLDACNGAMAANLMAGIVIDTANFQHPNTTPRTLRVAADLLGAGAPLPDIARRLYRTKRNAQLKLFGRVLERLESDVDGRLVWSTLRLDDLSVTGATQSESEGLSDLLSQSATGDLVILFKEQGPQTRLSVRTREGGVDATVLAGAFGGGGHARAAGATVDAPTDIAIPRVLAQARALLNGSRP